MPLAMYAEHADMNSRKRNCNCVEMQPSQLPVCLHVYSMLIEGIRNQTQVTQRRLTRQPGWLRIDVAADKAAPGTPWTDFCQNIGTCAFLRGQHACQNHDCVIFNESKTPYS